MASLADPSGFVVSAAVGFRHVLEAVLGFLERVTTTHDRDPVLIVLVVLLALPALAAYLLLAVVVFVVFVAATGYTRIVELGGVTPDLGWLGNLAIKLAVAVVFPFLIFCFVLYYMIGNVMLAARI